MFRIVKYCKAISDCSQKILFLHLGNCVPFQEKWRADIFAFIIAMIEFVTENIEMPDIDTQAVSRWIEAVAEKHHRSVDELCYCFCDEEYILKTNIEFLGHDYYTDIITFDSSEGDRISGDMLISLPTVESNAQQVDEPYARELLRVIIHGVLHLCGIDDKGPGEREIMERHEDEALMLWEKMKAGENAAE